MFGIDFNEFLFRALAFLIAITLHEYAHAVVAYRLGDPTPKLQGRLTVNPMAHFELIGTLMLLFAPIGWARPVQFNPNNFRGNKRVGTILTTLAGPLANLVVSIVFLGLYFGMVRHDWVTDDAWFAFFRNFFLITCTLNLYMFVFNLIPIPPLDGYWILRDLLPRKMAYDLTPLEKYGSFLLLLLILTPFFNRVIAPIVGALANGIQSLLQWI